MIETRSEYMKRYAAENRERLAAYQKEYKKQNREKIAEVNKTRKAQRKDEIIQYGKTYYLANKDLVAEKGKIRYEKNKDAILQKGREYISLNRSKIYARKKKYDANNVDSKREAARRYRAKKFTTEIERIDKLKVFERDGYICQLCGTGVLPYVHYQHPLYPSLDHKVPLSKGGGHTYSNIQTAHRGCNSCKRDREHLNDTYIQYITNEVAL